MQKAKISQGAVDELVRKTIGKRAVEKQLFKSSTNPKWTRYQMYGLSDGTICHVNLDAMKAHVLDKGSCVKSWRKRQADRLKRDEAKVARHAKRAEAKANQKQESIARKAKRDAAKKAAQ